ncbi:MAG: folate-binding protein YgfZ [Methylococcales bacterium]|nr:folate-binding protein YgfZ [Methylococcales bacterium]
MNKNWIDFLKSNNATITDSSDIHFSDSPSSLDNSITAVSHLSIIKVTGKDASQFLQGQLTCNINELTESNSFFAAFCNAKGRAISTLLIIKAADSFLLILPKVLIEKVIKKLQMYILRSDVQLIDDSDELCLTGLTTDKTDLLSLPDNAFDVFQNTDIIIKLPANKHRFLIIACAEQSISTWKTVIDKNAISMINSESWRYQDILAGLPWLTDTTSEEYIPQMLNIDKLGGISFKKGCYTGQEIIARTHYLGKAKRELLLAECGSTELLDNNILVISDNNEQSLGKVIAIQANNNHCIMLIVMQTIDPELKNLRLNNSNQDKIKIIAFQ